MHNRRTSRLLRTFLGALLVSLGLGACGGGSDVGAGSTTTDSVTPTYSTKAFVLPFDVTVPEWLPVEATTDAPNFVTWESASQRDPAVRFLVPVSVYRPGEARATPPPEDYLAYLLSQREQGATFADMTETTVGGRPATLVTASVQDTLDGSLGCPVEENSAEDCFGLQPELTLRIAVIDAGHNTLLAWLRHDGTADSGDPVKEFDAFEQMLTTLSFRDESPTPTAANTDQAATPLDGVWTKSYSYDKLANSTLLYDAEEVNDQNWGNFTFTLGQGEFTFEQENPRDTYQSSGTFVVNGDTLVLTLDNVEHFEMRWSIEGDTLTLERDESLGVAPTPYVLKSWSRGR